MTSVVTGLRGGSWVGSAAVASSDALTASAPGIAGWALEYVQPLNTWFDQLFGDPGSIASTAETWERSASTLVALADQLDAAERALEPLEGRMIRTLQLRYEDLRPVARDAADTAEALSAAVRLVESVVAGVRSFILDSLEQLSRLIDALFGFTLNPFDKVEQLRKLVAFAASFIDASRNRVEQMFDAFGRLLDLIAELGPLIDDARVQLRELLAQMISAVSPLAGPVAMIASGNFRDAMMELGDIERFDVDQLRQLRAALPEGDEEASKALEDRIEAWEDAQEVKSLDSLADLVAVNGTTDAMGGADATAIDIKLVRAPDGSEHWVVSMPSTQQWFDMQGSGAMNDGKNNLALMADGPLKTQYERAVLQAMREAGIAEGDPVVLSGFSQAGIMAANLASDSSFPYETIGVVTNGAPIDTFDIPAHVPVVSLQHLADPVPQADLGVVREDAENVERVVLPNPNGSVSPLDTHKNANYVSSLRDFRPDIDQKYAWMGGEVIDHQVFQGVQR